MTDTALANAVTGFATILSGVVTFLFTFLVASQPWRWRLAYLAIFVTGLPTVWYHGFGEEFWPKVADVGTNFLVSWLMVLAVLGDYYTARTRWVLGGCMLALNLWALYDMIATGAPNIQLVAAGSRGFSIRQLTLIANSLMATVLLYLSFERIPASARPLLHLQTAWFLFGAWLASAKNHRVDHTVLAYHAVWHVVGAFGFLIIWAFNHVRFGGARASSPS